MWLHVRHTNLWARVRCVIFLWYHCTDLNVATAQNTLDFTFYTWGAPPSDVVELHSNCWSFHSNVYEIHHMVCQKEVAAIYRTTFKICMRKKCVFGYSFIWLLYIGKTVKIVVVYALKGVKYLVKYIFSGVL